MMGNSEYEDEIKELSPVPLMEVLYDILHKFFPKSYPEIQDTVSFLKIEEN